MRSFKNLIWIHNQKCLETIALEDHVPGWIWFFSFFLLRKIVPELTSVPMFLYCVCGLPPQHDLLSGVGPCLGSKRVNLGQQSKVCWTWPLRYWASPKIHLVKMYSKENVLLYSQGCKNQYHYLIPKHFITLVRNPGLVSCHFLSLVLPYSGDC